MSAMKTHRLKRRDDGSWKCEECNATAGGDYPWELTRERCLADSMRDAALDLYVVAAMAAVYPCVGDGGENCAGGKCMPCRAVAAVKKAKGEA